MKPRVKTSEQHLQQNFFHRLDALHATRKCHKGTTFNHAQKNAHSRDNRIGYLLQPSTTSSSLSLSLLLEQVSSCCDNNVILSTDSLGEVTRYSSSSACRLAKNDAFFCRTRSLRCFSDIFARFHLHRTQLPVLVSVKKEP